MDIGLICLGTMDNEVRNGGWIKTVNVTKKDFSLYELFRKYNKGKVIYEVDFQRSALWEPQQKYELIESILMGLPLPIFYFKEPFRSDLVEWSDNHLGLNTIILKNSGDFGYSSA